MKIGLVADSQGDVDALEYACDLLVEELGAERLFFLGGQWSDSDELFRRKRAAARGREEYTAQDFLSDVASFVAAAQGEEKGEVGHRVGREGAEAFIARFSRVPERESLQYRDPAIARVLPELIGDRIAVLVHDKADLKREDIEAASFLVHGSSAEPDAIQIGARYFLTPGKLGGEGSRSCALVRFEAGRGEFTAYGLDGRELKKVPLAAAGRHKLSAR